MQPPHPNTSAPSKCSSSCCRPLLMQLQLLLRLLVRACAMAKVMLLSFSCSLAVHHSE
jgi:hypothetical protein